MKPKSWKQCPTTVLEEFLLGCDLEYDPYEGSIEETIHSILNSFISPYNEKIIDSAWYLMTEEEFQDRCKKMVESLKSEIKYIESFVDTK